MGWLGTRIKKYYTQMSMQLVISLSFTLVAVVGVVLIGAGLSFSFVRSSEQIYASQQESSLVYAQRNIDSFLRSVMTLSDTIYYNMIKNKNLDAEQLPSDSLNLLYAQNRANISSIALLNSGGTIIMSAPLSKPKPLSRASFTDWFTIALEKVENLHFGSPNVENLFENTDYGYSWILPMSRFVRLNSSSGVDSGVLVINIYTESLELLCSEISTGDTTVYITTRDGEIISHPQQGEIYSGIMEPPPVEYASLPDGTHNVGSSLIAIRTIGYTGWRVVSVSANNTAEQLGFQLMMYGAAMLILVLFLIVFINFRVSEYISRPLMELERSVHTLNDGGEVAVLESGSYEVKNLGKAIRQVVSTMRSLMNDVLEQERQKRLAELEVLQSQINPHFLYNTLDSVIWLTENGRNDEAVEMISSLARIFRISLAKGKSQITLAQEFAHAKSYLDIQKIRYKNRFSYRLSLPPELAECMTLKLIIQPILENAIYHGLTEDECDIFVTAYPRDKGVVIDVSDTGVGIPEEILSTLLVDTGADRQSKGSGIALINVDRRIKLAFGESYGLSISSVPDEGTTVSIFLPRIYE